MDDQMFDMLSKAFERMDMQEGANQCPQCHIEMTMYRGEYSCPCGYKLEVIIQRHDNDTTLSGGTIRMASGSKKGRVYTINGNNIQLRKRALMALLLQNNAQYTGPVIPMDVLHSVVDTYNNIQQVMTGVDEKKFVHRASIKNEILAGLIKFACIASNTTRKNKDIAKFMRLKTSGFAKGENILRELHAKGVINITVDEDPLAGYLDRYIEALELESVGIDKATANTYKDFISELIMASEDYNICVKSQISSKIVGCLWIVIRMKKLNICCEQLEAATDNTKRNTFIKFYNAVFEFLTVFVDIFNKYGIPYRI